MNCINLQTINCNGCGLCKNICPQNAIRMEMDAEGFLSPYVCREKCNECGACIKACNETIIQESKKNNPIEIQACQTKDQMWVVESTAGGFFPTLAQYIIEKGGVVFGTAYSSDMSAVVCKATTIDEIKRFNGSKYVQSDLSNTFQDVKYELENGNTVLFSGTPCQVAAIMTYLTETNTEKLITVDVICYGVPSPGLFKSYLQIIEKKKQAKVVDFRFRDKHENGWSHTTVITLQNSKGNISKITEKDYRKIPYYRMFGKRDCYRRSCYECNYNTINRITDFTTGNFWGIENMTSTFNNKMGVSMVLVNTEKGKKVFRDISDRLITKEMQLEQAVGANHALVQSSQYPANRDQVYEYWSQYGFQKMYHKFYSINYLRVGINMLKRALHMS